MHSHSRMLTKNALLLLSRFCAPLRRVRHWGVAGVLLFALVATAQQNTAPPLSSLTLGWDLPMRWLEDPEGKLEPAEVLAIPTALGTWETLNAPLNAGYPVEVAWLNLVPPQAQVAGDPVWLLALPTYLDSVIAYQRDPASGEWRIQRSGDFVPARLKPGIRQHLLRLEPGWPTLIRVQTTSAMQFSGVVYRSTDQLASALASSEMRMGISFGLMFALLIALWAASAAFRSYDLHALAVLGTVSTLHVFNVRGYPGLWMPESLTEWASHGVGMGAFLVAATLAWQVREQLTRYTRYRRTDRVLQGLIAVNLLGLFSVPFGYYSSVAGVNLLSLLLSDAIGISLCAQALWRHQKRAKHWLLLIAYGVHVLGGVPTFLVMSGRAQWNLDVTGLWQLQVLLFITLIACAVFVGMVLQYRAAQRHKDEAIRNLAESEHLLEDRIEERTQELSEARASLEHALESERTLRLEQRQFFHMISHEFRTPLAVVDSAAAEQQSFPSEDIKMQTERADQIRRACRRLTSLIDSCLINERLDSAGFTLQPHPANVQSLLEYAAQLVRWSPRHRLYLFTESAPSEWVCDPTLVRIALSNIVDNAVKYSGSGQIFIAAQRNDAGLLEISVADEGSGMSMELMDRIFLQFERGDRTDQSKGFGLGLWVARRVARLHGGDITVESRPGEGACFTLTLATQRLAPSPLVA
jgi:signal transduction histidine kinase